MPKETEKEFMARISEETDNLLKGMDKLSGETDKQYMARLSEKTDKIMKGMAKLSEETDNRKQELIKEMAITTGKTDEEVMKELIKINPSLGMSEEESKVDFARMKQEAHEQVLKEAHRSEATKSFFRGLKSIFENVLLALMAISLKNTYDKRKQN
jgi:hypothetical protein